jgi:hypothetical protein
MTSMPTLASELQKPVRASSSSVAQPFKYRLRRALQACEMANTPWQFKTVRRPIQANGQHTSLAQLHSPDPDRACISHAVQAHASCPYAEQTKSASMAIAAPTITSTRTALPTLWHRDRSTTVRGAKCLGRDSILLHTLLFTPSQCRALKDDSSGRLHTGGKRVHVQPRRRQAHSRKRPTDTQPGHRHPRASCLCTNYLCKIVIKLAELRFGDSLTSSACVTTKQHRVRMFTRSTPPPPSPSPHVPENLHETTTVGVGQVCNPHATCAPVADAAWMAGRRTWCRAARSSQKHPGG